MLEPKILECKRCTIEIREYRYRQAQESDFSQLITDSTIIRDQASGRPNIVYLKLEDDCSHIADILQKIHYEKGFRTSGTATQSKIFGYSPRIAIRNDYCKSTALAREDPEAHALIAAYAKRVAVYYQEFNTELYQYHQQQTAKVLPEWTLEDTVFTSGIINKNNPLAYHFDAGNFKNVWSNMLVFKHEVEGGYLAVPEYDIGFEVCNNSLLMFDGQNLLHGVTPIHKLTPEAYRYSIVYYSLQQMWNCLAPGEEVARIRKLRTQREEKRLAKTIAQVEGSANG